MGSIFVVCLLGLILIADSHVAHAHDDSPEDYVTAHNAVRSEIGVPNIVWDNTLAVSAQNYAKKRKDCKSIPSGTGGRYGEYHGENIAVSTGDMSGKEAVKLWVDEKVHYNHNNNSCDGGECIHYTQVIWSESQRLGCGKVRCDNGGTFVTCNYDPPGNIVGQSPY